MNEPSSRDGPRRLALNVAAVEVRPTDPGSYLVRVAGSWEAGAERPDARPELVVDDEGEERRCPALAETSGAAEKASRQVDAFRATFSVPEAVAPALAGALRLAIAGAVLDLPTAQRPGVDGEPPPGATVIDRAVLAERRARRAEQAEETVARRAEEAEAALRDLEAELAKLEVRLERALDERAALESQVAERERAARAAAQREYAERRRREEATDEAAGRVQEAEAAAHEARSRLRDAEARALEVTREAEDLRRRAAESEHALATTATRARAQPTPAGPPADVIRREAALIRRALEWAAARPRDDAAARALDAVGEADRRVREAMAALQRTGAHVQAERGSHEQAMRSLAADLERERQVRTAAERIAGEQRTAREAAERRAGELQSRLSTVIDQLRSELEAVRAQTAARADESDLRELATTAAEALREAEERIGETHRAAAELIGRIEHLERALAAERARREEAEAALATTHGPSADAKPSARPEPSPAPAPAAPWLPAALALMIERGRPGVVELLLALVAGQSLAVEDALDYRLRLEGHGLWSVSLRPGAGEIAVLEPGAKKPGDFQVAAPPAALLDLLVQGGSRELRRRVKVTKTWRRRRALRSIPAAELRPGRLAAAGIWLDPLHPLRALAELVEPAWTEGHDFVVFHEVTGPRSRRMWVRATSGEPLAVLPEPPPRPAAVTVQSTQSAFQRFLGGEPNGPEKWTIRGDVGALSALTSWLERARSSQGAGTAAPDRG